ncbi:MAG: hypothetical protein JWQ96_159 [Segetibacter sp.]|nr:hypothetical protein [Segetibacter sp.]
MPEMQQVSNSKHWAKHAHLQHNNVNICFYNASATTQRNNAANLSPTNFRFKKTNWGATSSLIQYRFC